MASIQNYEFQRWGGKASLTSLCAIIDAGAYYGQPGPKVHPSRLRYPSFPFKGRGTGPLVLPSGEQGNDLRVLVLLEADTIVVTLPGTRYSITYRKLHDSPWLVSSDARDDQDSPINKHTFRARAWTTAKDKARELGWIV